MKKVKNMNFELLKKIVIDVPENLDRTKKKETIEREIQILIKNRSNNTCELCGNYPSKLIHHIIPNGASSLDNLIDLCRNCHDAVHVLLFTSGKWKYPYKPNLHY